MKGKSARIAIWTPIIILCFFGLILGAFATYFIVDYQSYKQNGTQVEATITLILTDYSGDDEDHDVFVSYTYHGQHYSNVRLGYYDSSMKKGESIDIYVSPSSPTDIIAVKSINGLIIMAAIAAALLIVALVLLIAHKRRVNKYRYLKAMGNKIYATVTSIDTNYSIRVNSVHPVQIVLTDENGALYKSPNMYNFAQQVAVGDKVAVYVDNMDRTQYFVDITDKQTEQTPLLF